MYGLGRDAPSVGKRDIFPSHQKLQGDMLATVGFYPQLYPFNRVLELDSRVKAYPLRVNSGMQVRSRRVLLAY